MIRLLSIGLLGAAMITGVAAQTPPQIPAEATPQAVAKSSADRWLVQVWFEGGSVIAEDGEDLGRMEVFGEKGFLGCVLAPSVKTQWNETIIAPVSIGLTVDHDPGQITVSVEGDMKRLGVAKTRVKKLQ